MIYRTENGIGFNWQSPYIMLQSLVDKLQSGTFFEFSTGKTSWDLMQLLPGYFQTSLLYVSLTSVISLVIGTLIGISLSRRRSKWLREFFSLLGIIPDFILAIILQMVVIGINQLSGIKVARVATVTSDKPAILLPLLTMIIVANIHIIQSTVIYLKRISSQQFVLFAKARGLTRGNIIVRHIVPGILSNLRGDLYKYLAIIFSSLFITERIFNIPGMTRLIFGYAFQMGKDMVHTYNWEGTYNAQINVALVSLLALILMFYGINLLLNLFLRICGRMIDR